MDLDQFIAAVEILRRPELKGKPVVVAATDDLSKPRIVVATASYEAREFGVRSGMPMRTATKKLPDAVFLPSDPEAYEAVSADVMAVLTEFGGAVEVLGWDEAFVAAHTDDPEAHAARIQHAITERTELTAAVGIGDNKVRAKIATGFGKPGGRYRLTAENWFAVMGDRPTDALWGLGRKTATKLAELGLHTVSELAAADKETLAARFGPRMGPWYRVLAHGFGEAEVSSSPHIARSRSRETTFPENLSELDRVQDAIMQLARQVTEDVHAEGRPAVRVGVKVRLAPFLTLTRSVTLPEPTMDADQITAGALAALAKLEGFGDEDTVPSTDGPAPPTDGPTPQADGPTPTMRPIRLLGVRAEFGPALERSPTDRT